MFGRSVPRGSLLRHTRWLLILAVLAPVLACDESSTGPAAGVEGSWVGSLSNLTVYVRITESTVTVWDGSETVCFNTTALTITSRDGDLFTLQIDGTTETFQATIRNDDGNLIVNGLRPVQGQVTLTETSEAPSGFEECAITGQWEFDDGLFAEYVVITGSTFIVHNGSVGGCFDFLYFDLVSRGGDDYTLEGRSGADLDVTIRNEAGVLVVAFDGGFDNSYTPSTADLSGLGYCGGGDDPEVMCSALPAVTAGGSVQGELTSMDPQDADTGRYYDLYGLTLGAEQQVTISVTADDENVLDTWLTLWTGSGEPYAINDDVDQGTLNSALTLTLPAGCWRIEATSFDAGETGLYTLSVN